MGLFGLFNKSKKDTLDKGLEKTKQNVFSKLTRAVAGKSRVDDEVLDDLEEILVTSDVGVDTTIPFHLKVLDNEDFKKGTVYTNFIETHFKEVLGK